MVDIRKAFVVSILDAYGTRSKQLAIRSDRRSIPSPYLCRFAHGVRQPNSSSQKDIHGSTMVFLTWFRVSFHWFLNREYGEWLESNWSYLHSSIYISDDFRFLEIASDNVFAFFSVRNKQERILSAEHFSSLTSAKQIDTRGQKHVAQI